MHARALRYLVLVATLVAPSITWAAQTSRAFKPCAVPGLDVVARCGAVDVPEDPQAKSAPGKPNTRRIAIRTVIIPAISKTPAPDAVLFLAGGPGQAAAELAGLLMPRVAFLRESRDLIFIDQRGTGASNPLTCAPPTATGELMGRIFDLEALKSCRDRLAQRADLRLYTTQAAAADYESVLDALGYRQVNVWGVSYGTRLALELARRLPSRIRTLVLEAAVPSFFAWPTYGARDADAALHAVIGDCEADSACAAAYPTFRRDVDAAFARLAKPATARIFDPHTRQQVDVPFTSSDLAYATRGMLYGPDAAVLPRAYRAAAAGRYDQLAQAYVTRARTIQQEIATGVHLGVYCAEDVPFVDTASARKLSARTRLGTYLLDQYAQACTVWPRGTIDASFRDAVHSEVPTLIMSGRRDPVTPPWSADAVAKTLKRVRVIKWPAGAHGDDGLSSPACKHSIIREFVTTGQQERLSVGCAARERPRPFAR